MKMVIPCHVAGPSLQHTEALVLVHIAGGKHGLFPDHAFSLHLGVTTQVIMDVPVPPEKLGGTIAYIFDANVINEEIAWLARVRVLGREARPNADADAVGTAIEERLHAYLMRVMDSTP